MFLCKAIRLRSLCTKKPSRPGLQFIMKALIISLFLCYGVSANVHHHAHPYKILGLNYNVSESCFDGISCQDDEHVFGFVMDFYENHGSCIEDFELSGHQLKNMVLDELDEDMCLDVSPFVSNSKFLLFNVF
mgnify:CR=1 FL=1